MTRTSTSALTALLLACALLVGSASDLLAISVRPFANIESMVTASDLVGFYEVTGRFRETDSHGLTRLGYELSVIAELKGSVGSSLRVYSYSYELPNGLKFEAGGDLSLTVGNSYVLYLASTDVGWRPIAHHASVFRDVTLDQGGHALVPHEEFVSEALWSRIPDYFRAVELSHALAYVSAVANDGVATTEYLSAYIPASKLPSGLYAAAVPAGCDYTLDANDSDGLPGTRWQNPVISVYSDDSSEEVYGPGGLANQLPPTTATMTAEYDGLSMNSSGTANYTPTCAGNTVSSGYPTFANASLNGSQSALVISGDPCGEVPGTLPPGVNGGVLAIGGSFTSGTHPFDGANWRSGVYGFVVLNEGIDYLSVTDFRIMLTHELGHSVGFGHLDPGLFPNQNMNPACCNPINVKDEQCGDYAYPAAPPLPVELVNFTAKPLHHTVDLTWATASEWDADGFTVERSADGETYEAFVEVAASGKRDTYTDYAVTDPLPYSGTSYYRLKQRDLDGAVTYSDAIAVTLSGAPDILVSPNPASAGRDVVITGLSEGVHTVRIVDLAGRQTRVWQVDEAGGQVRLALPTDLSDGVFYLQAVTETNVTTSRFVVQ